jgi:hypothetical protein
MINDISRIKQHIQSENYQFRKHALERASERGIQPLDVKEAILSGNIIEDYPDDPRGMSCLVCGKTFVGDYLHIVCGLVDDTLWVVTVYKPEPEEWIDHMTRRASQ